MKLSTKKQYFYILLQELKCFVVSAQNSSKFEHLLSYLKSVISSNYDIIDPLKFIICNVKRNWNIIQKEKLMTITVLELKSRYIDWQMSAL